jgi:hypothetical protein
MQTSDFLLTIIIIIIFIGLYFINILGVGVQHIKDNWPLYRCNPVVIPFAGMFGKDVGSNFTYCIQNMQQSYMGELLKPIHYATSLLGNIGSEISDALNSVRAFFNKIRNFITHIIQEIMGVFLNLLIGIQRLTINIKDLFAKMMGVLATLLYILSGSIMTMNATWSGPPGQLVRTLCFHPNTKIQLVDGSIAEMKNLKLGDKLKNQQIVYATMNIYNLDNEGKQIEKLYSLQNGEGEPVLVTGSHLIFDKSIQDFVCVKDFPGSVETSISTDNLVCLITSDHTIPLGDYIFHDWEDNQEIIK